MTPNVNLPWHYALLFIFGEQRQQVKISDFHLLSLFTLVTSSIDPVVFIMTGKTAAREKYS